MLKPSVLLRRAIGKGYTQTLLTLHHKAYDPETGRYRHEYCALGAIGKEAGLSLKAMDGAGKLSNIQDNPKVGEIECLACPSDEEKMGAFLEFRRNEGDYYVPGTVEEMVVRLNDTHLQPFERIAEFLERIGC